jgi:hypothetical protein
MNVGRYDKALNYLDIEKDAPSEHIVIHLLNDYILSMSGYLFSFYPPQKGHVGSSTLGMMDIFNRLLTEARLLVL